MTKNELIKQLESIEGNPQIVFSCGIESGRSFSVCGQGDGSIELAEPITNILVEIAEELYKQGRNKHEILEYLEEEILEDALRMVEVFLDVEQANFLRAENINRVFEDVMDLELSPSEFNIFIEKLKIQEEKFGS